jgi:hypothetical protein
MEGEVSKRCINCRHWSGRGDLHNSVLFIYAAYCKEPYSGIHYTSKPTFYNQSCQHWEHMEEETVDP